jgi:flagellin
MVINTNTSALSAANSLAQSSSALAQSLARLSSGSKITSPADDSAGLAVSMKLSAQINRVGAAQNNVGNAISFNQTQDGYLQKVNDALNRMSELSVMAQDSTKTDSDRALYQTEFSSLQTYVSDVGTKSFNGVSLFSSTALSVTTDADGSTFSNTGVNLGSTTYTTATGSSTKIDTTANATTALTNIKAAITQLATDRASIGANEETLGYYNDQLSSLSNNLSAANSRITDVDIAKESTNYAKQNILVQSGTAMLAQANSMPNSVLKLIS